MDNLAVNVINKIRAIENHHGARALKINLSIQQQQQLPAAAEMAHCCQFLSPLFNSCAERCIQLDFKDWQMECPVLPSPIIGP